MTISLLISRKSGNNSKITLCNVVKHYMGVLEKIRGIYIQDNIKSIPLRKTSLICCKLIEHALYSKKNYKNWSSSLPTTFILILFCYSKTHQTLDYKLITLYLSTPNLTKKIEYNKLMTSKESSKCSAGRHIFQEIKVIYQAKFCKKNRFFVHQLTLFHIIATFFIYII